jgi:hypothetical protein
MREYSVLTLLGIAGVAATFSGFTGVVAASDRRAHGNWHPKSIPASSVWCSYRLSACPLAFVMNIAFWNLLGYA